MSFATLLAALGCALVSGIFLGFSIFIMAALGKLAPSEGIRAMQSINRVVINPAFLGLFFGTALLCAALGLIALFDEGQWWPLLLAGGLSYLIGTIGVTMLCNVPLNNRLAAADPESEAGAELWEVYLGAWTRWNHLRTLAGFAAAWLLLLGWRAM